jgi:hypothetical protein
MTNSEERDNYIKKQNSIFGEPKNRNNKGNANQMIDLKKKVSKISKNYSSEGMYGSVRSTYFLMCNAYIPPMSLAKSSHPCRL